MPEPDFYEFDEFEIDTNRRLLLLCGKAIPLKPRVFDTLLYLASNHGRVLEKDELMRAIWPDTTVEENNLNQNVSSLRRVLGEQRGENRYIVTVPGRGYKFVAAKPKFSDQATERQWCNSATLLLKQRKENIGAPQPGTTPGDSSGKGSLENVAIRLADRSRTTGRSGSGWNRQLDSFIFLRNWPALSVGLAAVIAVLVWANGHNRSPRTDLRARSLTANSSQNRIRSMAISPDHQQLAYADKNGIYLKLIQSGEIHPVPLPAGFLGDVDEWFQDGSHLLVSRTDQ